MRKVISILFLTILCISCAEEKSKAVKVVGVEPSDRIVSKLRLKDFSIVLDDMKIEDEPNFMVYSHKYKVLRMEKDSLYVEKMPWKTVNKSFFIKYQNDLGMEIISNHNGKLSKVAQPVGFGWGVGNEKHGEWEAIQKDSINTKTASTNNGRTRWRTHSGSPFFWFWLGSRRSTYRSDYNGYRSANSAGRPYYGSSRSNYDYGTRSTYQQKRRSSFFSRKKSNTRSWNSLTNKKSRNSSRYNNGSTTRSRSGGFGK